jgi:hypothetical protein
MVDGVAFPNYAGVDNIDDALYKELEDAGISAKKKPKFMMEDDTREVKTSYYGEITAKDMPRISWYFERAWYYWVAKGPGIPPEYAERLFKTHGTVARVEGHCGCENPLEYNRGFAVELYHVDTAEGLKALSDIIKEILNKNGGIEDCA